MRFAKSHFVWTLALVSGVVLITPTVATAEPTHDAVYSVMTRNMDLGSDYTPALIASDPASFALLAHSPRAHCLIFRLPALNRENIEHPTSNTERRSERGLTLPFDVRRSMFDVRCSPGFS